MQVAYSGQYSVAQPDYTAECLQMRNSGADSVFPVGEFQANVRLAQSCSRQNYRPRWLVTAANIPEYEGAISASGTFPCFLRSGSPAVDEYVQAFQKYLPNRVGDGCHPSQVTGWLAGKLFEKAAANVSDKPTTEDILNGLWAMKGETLGGLLPGAMARTFTKDQPTPDVFCTFIVAVKDRKLVAPQGLTPLCR
jgi:branched-chain amino acid transport system substrate-binding protein